MSHYKPYPGNPRYSASLAAGEFMPHAAQANNRTPDGGRKSRRDTVKAQRKASRRVDWVQIEISFPRV